MFCGDLKNQQYGHWRSTDNTNHRELVARLSPGGSPGRVRMEPMVKIWDRETLAVVRRMWKDHLPEEISERVNELLAAKQRDDPWAQLTSPGGVVFAAAKVGPIAESQVEEYRGQVRRRKAKRKYIKVELRDAVSARDGHRCLLCGTDRDLAVDHTIPVEGGGTNDPDNLQTLCHSCNSKKMMQIVDFRKPYESVYCRSCRKAHYRNVTAVAWTGPAGS